MSEINEERMLDLLADNATVGLSESEKEELKKLEAEFPELAGDDSFELAAAAFALANSEEDEEEMPSHIYNRIVDNGEDFVDRNYAVEMNTEVDAEVESAGFGSWFGWLGWAVAGAACLLLAFSFFSPTQQQVAKVDETPKPPTITEKRQELLASNVKVTSDWEALDNEWLTENKVEKADLKGDVVWSDSKQEGYMTFEGLPVNDASKEQYQLWIFDGTQDEKTPVDGGVFDVSDKGEVTVPIDAKLNVDKPTMFAITVEKPGGVVVSDRKKLILIGKV